MVPFGPSPFPGSNSQSIISITDFAPAAAAAEEAEGRNCRNLRAAKEEEEANPPFSNFDFPSSSSAAFRQWQLPCNLQLPP